MGPGAAAGRGAWVAALTALAYALVGAAGLLLAGPPGYASPLYPSAGVALAAAVVYGHAALPGVWLGAFLVNTGLGALRGQPPTLEAMLLPAVIGLGAALQAGVGAWLLRRWCGPLLTLDAPAGIARAGLLGGGLACLISPSIATPALWLAGVVDGDGIASLWGTWWLGDTLGVLIGGPLALTLIGQPAADWRPRRRTLALPLLAALAVIALAVRQTERLEGERRQALIERAADQLLASVTNRLDTATHALHALASAARVQGGLLDGAGLREASRWWLSRGPALQATGVALRVDVAALPAFEAAAVAAGEAGYRVFDRDAGDDRRRRGEVLAVRHLEPLAPNRSALGVNSLSIPAAREAIDAARDSGEARVTAAFRLTQSDRDEPGVVFYHPLYRPMADDTAAGPAGVDERRQRFAGVVFVTVRTEAALADLPMPGEHLAWCLRELDAAAALQRLAGHADCGPGAAGTMTHRDIAWGGRSYRLQVVAGDAFAARSGQATAWILGLTGVSAAALLGALLLTVTGHSRRTEREVAAATGRLRAEIDERERSEADARDVSARLRSVLDHAPLGLVFLDPAGLIVECNTRLAALAGRDAGELPGHSVLELIHPDDRAPLLQMRRDLLGGAATRTVAVARLLRGTNGPDSTRVRIIASALRDGGGQVLRIVAMAEDVSDQLRLAQAEKARERAEASNRAKNEFLSRMSHELRTPLNAMLGFAQLLGLDREPALAPHQAEWVRQVQRAGWHLLELINETLDLSRIEAGSIALAPQPVSLPLLAETVRSLLASAAAQRQVTVRIEAAPDLPAAEADPVRLRQVLTNLLSNAIKYNRPGGQVVIGLAREGAAPGARRVAVSVRDDGLGMSREQLERLFQPYDRLGREDSGVEGTGIGLVITRRLVELMGGTLEVDSRAGAGSTFRFTLPASAELAPPLPADVETQPAPYAQRRVHYVEDNETNVEVMRGLLAQRPQVRLEVSTLGLDGLAAIRREPPDLILLDMQLPDIAGPELLRFLKQDDDLAKIPVIVVSADATPDHVQQALTLGAMHYVTKPVAVADFLDKLDEALEAAETRWGM